MKLKNTDRQLFSWMTQFKRIRRLLLQVSSLAGQLGQAWRNKRGDNNDYQHGDPKSVLLRRRTSPG